MRPLFFFSAVQTLHYRNPQFFSSLSQFIGNDVLDHLRRQHSLRPQRGFLRVRADENERGQTLDLKLRGQRRFFICVHLDDPDGIPELRFYFLELARNQNARTAPRREEVNHKGGGAVLGFIRVFKMYEG